MAYSNTIGDIGERIVFNLLVEAGYDVHMSEDPYDEKGDLYIKTEDGKYTPVEVKTQMPKVLGRDRDGQLCETFTFHTAKNGVAKKSQEAKSKEAAIMFVQLPYVNRGHTVNVWHKPHNLEWIKGFNKYHKSETYEIPIKECIPVGQVQSLVLVKARDKNPKYNPLNESYNPRFVESPSYEVIPNNETE